MDDKRPIIITSIILGVLIAALVTVLLIRSCNKADDLLPDTTTVSDTGVSSSDGSAATDITIITDETGNITFDPNATTTTMPWGDPDDGTTTTTTAQTVAPAPGPATDGGEVIITEPTKESSKTPTKTPTKAPTKAPSKSTSKPADPTKSPATNAPIELPFVPADEL